MYHVIGIGLSATILYFISYFFCSAGYYSLQFHRRIWNTILAFTFTITALAGLFLALQTTYKWDIPVIKSILKVHVETGIGMAFSAIFHLLWHISYFSKATLRREDGTEAETYPGYSSAGIKMNLFLTGFVSSSVQLLLMREIMNISGGYELISGIFLGAWLAGSALGARLAYKSELKDVRKINLIFSLSPLLSVLLMFLLARLFLTSGETPSFLAGTIYTFLVLLPFCLISGFTFVKLLMAARSVDAIHPGDSFSTETAGGVVSGVLISIFTAGLLNTYQLLLPLILLSVSRVLLTDYIKSRGLSLTVKSLASLISAFLIFFNTDMFFRQILLPGMTVTSTIDTPYGNLTEVEYEDEKSLYYNQRLLSYSDDVTEREENVHYAMLQSISPENVILISGSLYSHYPEIMKYPVKKLTFIEIDPTLVKTIQKPGNGYSLKPLIINKDAFSYLSHRGEMADVIILLVPPPSTMMLNRYYTAEFFRSAHERLKEGGVFICSPGQSETYYNSESIKLHSSVANSLRSVFRNVIPVAGNKLYFVASDGELSTAFCRLAEEKGINNFWVSSDFLSDDLTSAKSKEINSLLDKETRINTVAAPIASFHYQSYNLSRNSSEKVPAIVFTILIFALPAVTIGKRCMAMYFSAFALAGFEIVILLTLQIISGSMYHLTGLIIAGVMTGLALGAGTDFRFLRSASLLPKMAILIVFYAGFGAAYSLISLMKGGIHSIAIIVIAAMLPAIITGNIFRVLTAGTGDPETSSLVYGADLAGSAAGFIVVAGLAVPVLGISTSMFLLSIMVFAGIVFGTKGNK